MAENEWRAVGGIHTLMPFARGNRITTICIDNNTMCRQYFWK